MALVAYDYESGSDNEDEENPTPSVTTPKPSSEEHIISNTLLDSEDLISTTSKLFSNLPETKPANTIRNNTYIEEEKLEDFIPKYQPPKEKKSQKVKITIPSLSQFEEDEDDEPEKKKAKILSKGSGLLSVLPPVKGTPLSTKSFVPNVLKNKPVVEKQKSNTLLPHVIRKNAELAKKAAIKKIIKPTRSGGSDIEESDDEIDVPETFDEDMWNKVCGRPKPKETIQEPVEEEEMATASYINIAPEPEKPYDGLDNKAFKELVGKSKRPVNIKLVDINEEEILPEKEVWLKSITDPDQIPKAVIEDPVDTTRKKKHHITYLAEQAKANEQELQNQWASSRFNRNQTRSKYGF